MHTCTHACTQKDVCSVWLSYEEAGFRGSSKHQPELLILWRCLLFCFFGEVASSFPLFHLKISSSSLRFSSQIRGKLPLFTNLTINDWVSIVCLRWCSCSERKHWTSRTSSFLTQPSILLMDREIEGKWPPLSELGKTSLRDGILNHNLLSCIFFLVLLHLA